MVYFQSCMINASILYSPFINTLSHYSLLSQESLSVVVDVVAVVVIAAVATFSILFELSFSSNSSPFSAFKQIQLKFLHCSSFLVWSSSTGKVITHGNCVGWRWSKKKRKINGEMSLTFFYSTFQKINSQIWVCLNIITTTKAHIYFWLCSCISENKSTGGPRYLRFWIFADQKTG